MRELQSFGDVSDDQCQVLGIYQQPKQTNNQPSRRLTLGKSNAHAVSNYINNQKYSVLNFIPLVLYNQFKLFFNFFQLMLMLSQFIPPLKVGFLFSYLAPLVVVLILTMLKQAFDDFKRYRRDTEANSAIYQVIKDGRMTNIKSRDLKPGDIVLIKAKERIPADLVILYTSQPSGTIFIKTDQLDGQTDWKIRRAVKSTQDLVQRTKNLTDIRYCKTAEIAYTEPHKDIYQFVGRFNNQQTFQPLTLDNTAWANTVLAAGEILGVIIFTGRQTRCQMNSKEQVFKLGKLDEQINYLSKLLFILMMILSLVINVFQPLSVLWPLTFFRYLLLLSSILPISLRVNMDFGKLVFSYRISNDPEIGGAICRNSTIPEQLGRIEYLLTDKTGTLTYNDMSFKRLGVNQQVYTTEDLPQIKKLINKGLSKFRADQKSSKRKIQTALLDTAICLAICNNVTPVVDNGQRILQASSPDQIALVKFAQELGVLIVDRVNTQVTIRLPDKLNQTYQIIVNFPFNSNTKRMGIVVRNIRNNKFNFYLKGADMVMVNKARPIHRGYIQDQCDNFSRDGLRTLVVCQKQIQEEYINSWLKLYHQASAQLTNRQESMLKMMEKLEVDLQLLAITGVEDKLQDDVAGTLESLRMAGIKVWMLTGDKVQTAKCIAISAGLKSANQSIYEVKGEQQLVLRQKLLQYQRQKNAVLLLDGNALTVILERQKNIFFQQAINAPAVICCRCSPSQKAIITQEIRKMGFITAGVGDGGNDVGMILQSSYGIGIMGKEGNQASMASDASILQFKHLKNLLLWHGRNSYKLGSSLCQFVIHRGLVISILQMMFTMLFYLVAIPLYNGFLMLGYATIYTCLPVFCIIFDQKLSRETTLKFPNLYVSLRKNREMGIKRFLVWCWISIYQGLSIIMMTLLLFQKSFLQIVTITFSALILSELLNVTTQIYRYNLFILGAQIITLLIYGVSLVFLNQYIDTSRIDKSFAIKVISIVGVSWLPVHIIKRFYSCLYPNQEQKIR